MQFTPIPDPRGHAWHSVRVEQVWLGRDTLVADDRRAPDAMASFRHGKRTILDSGTTDTYLPADLEPYMEQAWKNVTGLEWQQRKRDYTHEEYLRLPEIHLVLQGNVTLTLQPQYYMEGSRSGQPWAGKRRLVNRVYTDEHIGAVLGLNAMMGYDIYFEGESIGLARADCL